MIGERVRITVLDTRGRHVRLGIEAPEELVIRREELSECRAGVAGPREKRNRNMLASRSGPTEPILAAP